MAGMEGRGPYRIYDPGGGTEENGSAAFERLVEENTRLKEKMQGIKSIGNCCVARGRGWRAGQLSLCPPSLGVSGSVEEGCCKKLGGFALGQ